MFSDPASHAELTPTCKQLLRDQKYLAIRLPDTLMGVQYDSLDAGKPDKATTPMKEEMFKALTDVLVAVLVYVVVVHVAKFYDNSRTIHYDRLFGFTVTFVTVTLLLRLTKKPMGNLLINGMYFMLASLFANDILGK